MDHDNIVRLKTPRIDDRDSRDYYVPPFRMVQQALGISTDDLAQGNCIPVPLEFFRFLLSAVVGQGFFDEKWYLETYPDVEKAILRGETSSASEHYLKAGYYEGRSPGPRCVDRRWYEKYYSDVGDAVKKSEILDSAEHFQTTGYFEGRVAVAEHLPSIGKWRALLGLP